MKCIKFFVIFLIIMIITTGCKTNKKQEAKVEKIEKAPDSLSEISKGLQEILGEIETIEKVIDGTDKEDAKAKQEEKEKDKEKEKEKEDNAKKESEDNAKKESQNKIETKEKDNEKFLEKEEKLLKQWEKVDKKIEEIHEKWNVYEPEAMKKGATTDKTDKFEESINSLATSIEIKDINDIYNYGSESMLNLKPMFDLYRDEIKGDISKLKYITYQSYLKAIKGNSNQAISLLNESEEDIQKIKLKLEKKDSKIEIIDRLDLSIMDMSKSMKMKSIKLIRMKKDIIIKNLEELDK